MTIPYFEKDSSDPSLPMNRPIPRRDQMQKWCAAERAIFDAAQAVEAMGADPLLTEAVNLLHDARRQVADFVDGPNGPTPILPGHDETMAALSSLTIRRS